MTTEHRRFKFVLMTIILLLVLNTVGSLLHLGWKAITFNVAVVLILLAGYVHKKRDPQLKRWLLLGTVAGFVELVADAWLVERTGTLVYPAAEPMIWASPAYMPFAWAVVVAQIGTVGDWLRSRKSLLTATLLSALAGGINIPLYEHLAKDGGWWSYQNTPMLFSAPYYVIVGEILLCLPLVWMGRSIEKAPLARSAGLGAVEGLVMFAAVWVGYILFGPCSGALIQLPCP